MSETIAVVTLEKLGFGEYTIPVDGVEEILAEIIENLGHTPEIGDSYTIKVHEMERTEFDALPEFDGW